MNLTDFDIDIIIQILIWISVECIPNVAQLSIIFSDLICDNNKFWRLKFIHDFEENPLDITSWKRAYQNYGKVFMFGLNIGSSTRIPGLRAKFITCGRFDMIAIDFNDNVWFCRDNENTQLKLENVFIPTKLFEMKVKYIYSSLFSSRTLMIDFDDNVWTLTFDNKLIQIILGQCEKIKSVYPSSLFTMILDMKGNIWKLGGYYDYVEKGFLTLLKCPNLLERVQSISCGENYVMIIDIDNNVWAFGWGQYGRLGLGDSRDRYDPTLIPGIKAKIVACGGKHTIILDINDNIYSFGYNCCGQLGLGDIISRSIPTLVPWKSPYKPKSISCGYNHSMIVDTNNDVWAFGHSGYNQLGLSPRLRYKIPTLLPDTKAQDIACGKHHTTIITGLN
jgi:alpha-tubulin suppressor-like RCC1 family protein